MTAPPGSFSIELDDPCPGVWPANIHLHAHGTLKEAFPGAYYWDFETRSFPELPDELRRIVYAVPSTDGTLAEAYALLGLEWRAARY